MHIRTLAHAYQRHDAELTIIFVASWCRYVGLAVFCGYIVCDTQSIIDRADQSYGQAPSVTHDAMRLFTNLVAIFVRILIILIQNSGKKDEQNNNRRKTNTVRR